MDLKELSKEISKIQNEDIKMKYLKKHIKRTYCPVKEKIEYLNKIKELSIIYGEKELYHLFNKILFKLGIIYLYSDINISIDNKEKVLNEYDILCENIYFYSFLCSILEEEINELLFVNESIY